VFHEEKSRYMVSGEVEEDRNPGEWGGLVLLGLLFLMFLLSAERVKKVVVGSSSPLRHRG